jgi:hypothetical protein
MSSIKLKHSGGNSVIIAAPSSNPASDRTLTLPGDADATLVTSQSTLDATKLSGNLPALNGSALTNLDAGKVLQVVNSQSSTNKSTSGDTVLALTSVTITPASTSSKILLFLTCSIHIHGIHTANGQVRLYRGTTSGTFLGGQRGGSANGTANHDASFGINYLDQPNTTSATTYTLAIKRYNSNSNYVTTDSRNYAITALEIGA